MSPVLLLVLAGLGLLLGSLRRPGLRRAGILLFSVGAVYGLQPATPLRYAAFWLPTLALGLTILVWAAVRTSATPWRADLPTMGLLVAAVAVVAIAASAGGPGPSSSLRPPPLPGLLTGFAVLALVAVGIGASAARAPRLVAGILIVGLVSAFVVLKAEPLSLLASAVLRRTSGQSPTLAAPVDLTWLGFSYLAFRLLHVLLDRRSGHLPPVSLGELVSYALFFPALTAGPIDRVERFVEDLRRPSGMDASSFREGGRRIVLGMVKKFILADTLSMIALQPLSAARVSSSGWLWVLLYAYSLQLYFDFSGYTDIAIGISRWIGVRLPENFQRPYLQPNLTAFWNSWHITLAQWFRAYVFNPLTRALRTARRPWPTAAIILTGQLATMVLIGLWHGVAWGFALWGVWHGLGLFLQNRWSTWMRGPAGRVWTRPALARLAPVAGKILTFHFVTLGWVWFTLPDTAQAAHVFLRLFGG